MTRKLYLETFGCQMNVLDSELVMGQLRARGYESTDDRDAADVVMFNTCSVREHAEQKVWSRLGALRDAKAARPGLVIGVIGCMAERDGVDIFRRFPHIDVLCGPGELDKLPAMVVNASMQAGGDRGQGSGVSEEGTRGQGSGASEEACSPSALKRSLAMSDPQSSLAPCPSPLAPPLAPDPWPLTPPQRQVALMGATSRRSSTLAAAEDHLELLDLSRSVSAGDDVRQAYVRITRGCNKFCTYCVVPYTRGAEVHRPPQNIVDEVRMLADAGSLEVTLLGQTINHYAFAHGDGRVTSFAELLYQIHESGPAPAAAAVRHELPTRLHG